MSKRFNYYLIVVFILISQFMLALAYAGEVVVKRHAVIREEPRSSASRLGTADPGERYLLLSESPTNKWYNIQFQGNSGWIYANWIELVDINPGQNIRIASFNTLHLGWGTNKMLEHVTTILSNYDLVALQEVMKEEALIELVESLELITSEVEGVAIDWDYVLSEKLGRSSYREFYAFVWRQDKAQKIPDSEYVVSDDEDSFIREPLVASFQSGTFDFTLICTHFIFGNSKADRRNEARAIADVFEDVQNQSPNENDIILLGDFNLSPNDYGWADLKNINNMTWILNPPTLTSIGDDGMKNLYDNIWFQSNYLAEYTGESNSYEFMHEIFEDDIYKNAKTYVSDHVPVYAVFRIDQPDDD